MAKNRNALFSTSSGKYDRSLNLLRVAKRRRALPESRATNSPAVPPPSRRCRIRDFNLYGMLFVVAVAAKMVFRKVFATRFNEVMSRTQSMSCLRLIVIEANSLLDKAYFVVLRILGIRSLRLHGLVPLFSSLALQPLYSKTMRAGGLIPESRRVSEGKGLQILVRTRFWQSFVKFIPPWSSFLWI